MKQRPGSNVIEWRLGLGVNPSDIEEIYANDGVGSREVSARRIRGAELQIILHVCEPLCASPWS